MAGRAGVHISYLIVALVVCLGLVWWVVRLNSDLEDMTAKRDKEMRLAATEKANYARLYDETQGLRVLLTGDPGKTPDVGSFNDKITAGATMLSEATGDSAQKYTNIQDLYEDQYVAIRNYKGQAEAALKEKRAREEDYKSLEGTKDESRKKAEEEAEALRAQINEAQKRAERIEREASEESQRMRTENEAIVDELKVQINDLKRQNWLTDNRLKNAMERIADLESERIQDASTQNVPPDGKIVEVDNDLSYAWIDIGKNDQLTPGLIFEVFQNVKGGMRLAKGRVQVLTVQDAIAKVAVLNTFNRLNPIAKEDFVTSPFFSREHQPKFVIAGEKTKLGRWSKEELSKGIVKYGGKLDKNVTIDTDYLIAIEGYEASPEFSTARELRVKIITEQELSGLIE